MDMYTCSQASKGDSQMKFSFALPDVQKLPLFMQTRISCMQKRPLYMQK